jgi:hypothetical protein
MSAEPIWKEDVEKELEYLGEGARNLAEFYHRLKALQAPAALLDELAVVWQGLDSSRRRLEALLPCFPPEPRTSK